MGTRNRGEKYIVTQRSLLKRYDRVNLERILPKAKTGKILFVSTFSSKEIKIHSDVLMSINFFQRDEASSLFRRLCALLYIKAQRP
ncbi:hypothetical protein Anas_13150 [Armadillidium nasatum]|uniref:Uncharacterized protein n=1 Tax=Armadillidium nasatum TaxID=96803 RepID=A0A5N5TBP5_9CRUS|nr:hypothetical protein Anas_13150 [Armadillidium nasatum]